MLHFRSVATLCVKDCTADGEAALKAKALTVPGYASTGQIMVRPTPPVFAVLVLAAAIALPRATMAFRKRKGTIHDADHKQRRRRHRSAAESLLVRGLVHANKAIRVSILVSLNSLYL
jgi:hypothetical protein